MFRLHTLKYRTSQLTFFVLLLLVVGPAQNSWCFQDGAATVVPDTLVRDCHFNPSGCFTSTNMVMEKGSGTSSPIECDECLDLSSEDFASISIQDRNCGLVCSPCVAYFQPPSVVSLEATNSLSLISHARRPLRTSLNLHRSIQSTVLII